MCLLVKNTNKGKGELVKNDPSLKHLKSKYTNGPDFVDPNTNAWWDMTTLKQWDAHVKKYGEGGTQLNTENK